MAKKKTQKELIDQLTSPIWNSAIPNYKAMYPDFSNITRILDVSENTRKIMEAMTNYSTLVDLQKTLKQTKEISLASEYVVNKKDRSVDIKDVNKDFKEGKLVLVLGAGVSMTYGLPNWQLLLQKLMVTTLNKKENSSLIAELFSFIFSPNPLIAGRYLQKYYDENEILFEEEVRKILYKEIDSTKESKLMDEIVKFCIAAGKSPNLNSIITYNFDDLLEQNIEKLKMDLPYKSIFGNGQEILPSELPIYHVHGYLPHKGDLNELNRITFGENFYHQQYGDTYSWNNIVQINKFREFNCLFIGTSLTDPNTRRLLDIANEQRFERNGSHYLIKPRYNREYIIKGLTKWIKENDKEAIKEEEFDEFVQNLTDLIEVFEENDLLSLGIKTIWLDSYDEIPTILSNIRIQK